MSRASFFKLETFLISYAGLAMLSLPYVANRSFDFADKKKWKEDYQKFYFSTTSVLLFPISVPAYIWLDMKKD